MIRVYKNRQACFYRRISAARNGEKTFTKVTSPKSSESTISTIPADMSGRDTCSYFVVLCFYTARETVAERNA